MDLLINFVIVFFVLAAFYTTAHYLSRVRKTYKSLINSLDSASSDIDSLLNKTENVDLMEECDALFNKYENLANTWFCYMKHLNDDKTYALIHSKEFFSREKLIKLNTKNIDRIKALPGLLTAWGLLGTFIAILLGLKGIDPNNIATINNLIHGLSAKFFSSIAALFCSIFFVFYEKGLYSQLGDSCFSFQEKLEEIFPTISTNEILQNMQDSMGAQVNTMNAMNKSLTQNSLESIEKMVDIFRKSLSEGTAEQFKNIADTTQKLAVMVDNLLKAQDVFSDRMVEINEKSKELAQQHEETLERLSQTLEKVNEEVEIFKDTIVSAKESYGEFSEIAGSLSSVAEEFSSVVPSMQENNESIAKLSSNLTESVKYFNNVTNEISGAKLDEIIKHFQDGIKSSLDSIKDGLNEDMGIIKQNHDWHNKQFDKFVNAAEANIDKIHTSMKDFAVETEKFLSNYDESIAKAINYLNNNIHTMDNSLKDNLKNLESNFADLNKTLKDINEKTESAVK